MTPERLAEIRARLELRQKTGWEGESELLNDDIPALLAEVERLRGQAGPKKVFVVRQGAYLVGVYTTREALLQAAEFHGQFQAERGVIWINEVEVDDGCVCHPVSAEAERQSGGQPG